MPRYESSSYPYFQPSRPPSSYVPVFSVSGYHRIAPPSSVHCLLALTRASTSAGVIPQADMCWFTLTPAKGKKHHRNSSDSSCAEELVRVHRSPSPRFSDIKVKIPSSVTMEFDDHHHHQHPHLHPHLQHHHSHHLHPLHMHPLHMHPLHGHHHHHHPDTPIIKLRGPGRKRCPSPPGPPPPTRDHSRRPRSRAPSPAPPREPIYRTQVVEPAQVRETTRIALRNVHSGRQQGRLRRVAGYEVLGREAPWQWSVSSTVGSSTAGGGKWTRRRGKGGGGGGGGMKYPPFGTMDRWL